MKVCRKILLFYYEGFKQMTVGKNLWLIILIKLFIIFAVFRLFFFPDFLNERFDNETDKSDYIIEELTNKLP
jgi:Na+/H+ antiporter NhaD/arsenite permease-like protein